MKSGSAAEGSFEHRKQCFVKFDRVQFFGSRQQIAGQGASPRADFDDTYAACDRNSIRNAL
jgi:hypothetical protein